MGTSVYGYYFKTKKQFKEFIKNDRLGIGNFYNCYYE